MSKIKLRIFNLNNIKTKWFNYHDLTCLDLRADDKLLQLINWSVIWFYLSSHKYYPGWICLCPIKIIVLSILKLLTRSRNHYLKLLKIISWYKNQKWLLCPGKIYFLNSSTRYFVTVNNMKWLFYTFPWKQNKEIKNAKNLNEQKYSFAFHAME